MTDVNTVLPIVAATVRRVRAASPAFALGAAVLFAPAAALAASSAAAASQERLRVRPNSMAPTEVELRIWNDPAFRRSFAESYRAETDIEPTLDREEIRVMRDVLDLIDDAKLEEARARLTRALRADSSAALDLNLGNIHFQLDEYDEAVEAYVVATGKFPKFRRAWRALAVAHMQRGDFEAAIRPLGRVIELGGSDALTYGLLGFANASVGRSLNAETAYRMAMLLDPDTLDWKEGFARSLFRQNRFGEAVAFMDGLITEFPEETRYWLLQASAFIGMGKPLEAAGNYEFVDALGAADLDTLNILADIYVNEGFFDAAVSTYIRAMEKDSSAPPERALAGARVLVARSALDESRRLADAIEMVYGDRLADDVRTELLRLRSRVALAEGATDEQVRILEEIVDVNPLDGDAIVQLGLYHERQGEPERAILYYERAKAITGYEAMANLHHGQLLVRQRKFAEALPLLRKSQQAEPNDAKQDFIRQVEDFARRSR